MLKVIRNEKLLEASILKGEPPFVWAGIKYFSPCIQGTGLRVKHNVPLLLQTQSADPGHRVEDPAPVNYSPVKSIWNSRIAKFETPDVS